ncbi:unnamed protein product [Calypogeia fissa]
MSNRPVMRTGVTLFLLQMLLSFSLFGIVNGQVVQPSLSTTYYSTTCPRVYSIVDQVVGQALKQSRNIAGGLLRLHFHDCFVRGCDASNLIDSIPPQIAEKDGIGNVNSLRGFEVIDAAKTALEKACPGVVSCADIVALVARSAVFEIGGPSWFLPVGRRDGNTSNAGETVFNLPPPFALYPQLVNMFAAKGLTEQDMVVLSGAHTIGNTHCNVIESRLYNSSGKGGVDPNLDPTYAAQLKSVCPFSNGQLTTVLPMDPTLGNDTFDNMYYKNVRAHRGIFISDAALLSNATGAKFVAQESFSNPYPFFDDFSKAMTRMSSISVLLAPEGDVRRNCRVFNPPSPTPAPAPAPVPASSSPSPTPTPVPAPAPVPIASAPSPTPAPVPIASAPGPTPVPAAAPVPVASAPSPAPTPAPAPVPIARSPSPNPVPAPAPVPILGSPSPTPVLAPAPVLSTPSPTPVLAPAPVPISSAPSKAPSPSAVPTPAPVPDASSGSLAPSPEPIAMAPTPVPASDTPAPAPISTSPAPAPISTSPAPTPAPVSTPPAPPAPIFPHLPFPRF